MKNVTEDFYTKEVNKLLHEDESQKSKALLYTISSMMVSSIGYVFTTMDPPIDENKFFVNLDQTSVVSLKSIKKPEPKKPEPKKPEPIKKITKNVTKENKTKLTEQKPQQPKKQNKGGGNRHSRVTSTGVFNALSSINSATIANADPFGKGGFTSGLDALMAGSNGLKTGGGNINGRSTGGGVGFGPGSGGIGGGNGEIGNILASLKTSKSIKMVKRHVIKVTPETNIAGTGMSGGRSKEAIRKVVIKRIGGLKYLYKKYLSTNPDLAGKITIKMVISPSGKVIRATILESSLEVIGLERAIVKAIKRWEFGRVPKGTATVIYPFNFSS